MAAEAHYRINVQNNPLIFTDPTGHYYVQQWAIDNMNGTTHTAYAISYGDGAHYTNAGLIGAVVPFGSLLNRVGDRHVYIGLIYDSSYNSTDFAASTVVDALDLITNIKKTGKLGKAVIDVADTLLDIKSGWSAMKASEKDSLMKEFSKMAGNFNPLSGLNDEIGCILCAIDAPQQLLYRNFRKWCMECTLQS